MSKKLYSMLCAATLLSLTACTADDPFATGSGDGNVIFTVQAPGQLGSRAEGAAFGDGTTATRLDYYLYQVDGEAVSYIGAGEAELNGLKAQVPMNLVTGKTYKVVWLAQDPKTKPYTYDAEQTHTISINYDELNLDQNLESRDAFYQVSEVKVTGAMRETVQLYRPFAQVNFGTSDMSPTGLELEVLKKAFGDNLEGLKTSLKVTASLPTTLNLLTKEVGESEDVEFTFNATGVPANQHFPYQPENKDAEGNDVDTYEYLAMDYILCGENGVVDLDFSVLNGETVYNTIKVSSAPVKANYRTNIFGQLLTSTVDFDVEIQPMLNDFTDWEVVANGVIYDAMSKCYIIQNAEGLKWFNNEANVKKNNFAGKTIKLGADIDMAGIEWRGLYDYAYDYNTWFRGTFDGDDHTISNLTATATYQEAGFFSGMVFGVVKNLNLKNVNVSGNYSVGGIAGVAYTSKIENCTVDGGTIVTTPKWFEAKNEYNEGNNAGGIVGLMVAQPQSEAEKAESSTGVIDCKVSNVEVRAYRKVGAVAGSFSKNKSAYAGDPVVKGNSATDCSVMAIMDVTPYNGAPRKDEANELFGSFNNYDDIVPAESANTATNVTVTVVKGDIVENGLLKDENNEKGYIVTSAAGLEAMSDMFMSNANNSDKTFTLAADIDAKGAVFESDWRNEMFYRAVIDGNGHTISNMTIKGGIVPCGAVSGAVVKNLTFKNCHAVQGGSGAGVAIVAAQVYGNPVTIENVHVIDCSVEGNFGVGGLVGQLCSEEAVSSLTLKNCSVKNTKLTAFGNSKGAWIEWQGVGGANAFIGAVCTWWKESTITLDGCTAENNTFENDPSVVGGALYVKTQHYTQEDFATSGKKYGEITETEIVK